MKIASETSFAEKITKILRPVMKILWYKYYKKVLTDEMAIFIVLNTASIQLIPTTVIAIRSSLGSQNPVAIIFPVWIATICAAIAGIFATKLFIKIGK